MDRSSTKEILRLIPSVDAMLQMETIAEALARYPRRLVLDALRQILDETRETLLKATEPGPSEIDRQKLAARAAERVELLSRFTFRRVVNATGIIIHTNLGRSLLPEKAVERLELICSGYNNLEYDIDRGERGSRHAHAEAILRELTGAEAALVLNNNAGAVLLALNTLAQGGEVIVSRGELVEIGGSFRIPDVMSSSGATLREVGTTNRTHLKDYASAINEQTALLMKVHTSNYRVIGFTAEVGLDKLVGLGRERGLPVIEDLGSGCFVDLAPFGLHGEITVQETIRAGADLVTFSGDKLLGGPQAGIMVGRSELIDRCKKNPMTRALRVGKMTLAALEATLRLYRDEHQALEQIPTLRMISTPEADLEPRAHTLATLIRALSGSSVLEIAVKRGHSQVGGGSLPAQNLPTRLVAVKSETYTPNRIEQVLRNSDPAVIGRIESDAFLMDLRTMEDSDFEPVRIAFEQLLRD